MVRYDVRGVTWYQPDEHSGTEASSGSVTAVQCAALTRRYLTFSLQALRLTTYTL